MLLSQICFQGKQRFGLHTVDGHVTPMVPTAYVNKSAFFSVNIINWSQPSSPLIPSAPPTHSLPASWTLVSACMLCFQFIPLPLLASQWELGNEFNRFEKLAKDHSNYQLPSTGQHICYILWTINMCIIIIIFYNFEYKITQRQWQVDITQKRVLHRTPNNHFYLL